MKPRIAAITLLLAALIVFLWSRRRDSTERTKPESLPAVSADRTHGNSGAAQFRDGDRLAGLEPRLRKVVTQLEDFREQWERRHRQNPYGSLRLDRLWRQEALAELQDHVSEEDVKAILQWEIDHSQRGSVLDNYFSEPLHECLAILNPDACRSILLAAADPSDDSNDPPAQMSSWEGYYRGLSERDPLEALRVFTEDRAARKIKRATWQDAFRVDLCARAAAISPGTIRQSIQDITDESDFNIACMGFCQGAPAGQDWARFCDEARKALLKLEKEDLLFSPEGLNILYSIDSSGAQRWFLEDPRAALNWYSTRDYRDREELNLGSSLEDLLPKQFFEKLSISSEMNGSTAQAATAVGKLLESDRPAEREIAVVGLTEIIRPLSESPWFSTLSAVPDSAIRSEIFMSAVNRAEAGVRNFDPFAAQLPLDDSPNPAVENLRPWISKMGLSAEDAAAAEAHLQDIEAKEASIRRAEPQKEDAPANQALSDPFAPATGQ